MTEEKFTISKHYKINGKHFHPKNQWPGCLSWLQFNLLIDLIFGPVHSERRRSLPLSLLAKPEDAIICKRANTICHFNCLNGKWTVIFFNNLFAKSLLTVDLQLSQVSFSHAGWRRLQNVPNSSCLSKNI